MAIPALIHALRVAVDKLITAPFPQMAELYAATHDLKHVLTLRLESFGTDFDVTVARLLRFLNVPPSVPLHAELAHELRKHDTKRWSLEKRSQSGHVYQAGRLADLTHEKVLVALWKDKPRSRKLAKYSATLGYDDVRNSTTSQGPLAETGGRRVGGNAARVYDWIRGAKKGFCGHTVAGSLHSCHRDRRGSFGLSMHAARTLESAVRVCLDACRRCARCRYITVSPTERDCSWYHDCDLDQLQQTYDGFLSGPSLGASLPRNVTPVLQEVVLFMHLEKTAGTLVRTWMKRSGWARTAYCDRVDTIQDKAIGLLENNESRVFVEHHCGIDW